MKNLFLVLFVFSCFFAEAQQDTIPFEGNCIEGKPNWDAELTLNSGTLHLSGSLPANCCGFNFITYDEINNPFELTIDHSGDVCYCICPYAVDHQFHGFTDDSVHVIIEPRILDTVIYDNSNEIGDFESQNKARCYPTPSTSATTIEFPNRGKQSFKLHIYNQTGELVFSKNAIRANKIELKKETLLPGIYFYRLSAQNGIVYNGKILISSK
ncbi:MAG: T9SS type A sorting domain-containing protein [Salinivirgaceae bacterium]